MTRKHLIRDLLHRTTHRVPGVRAHGERPAGHEGGARHGSAGPRPPADHRSHSRRWNHSPARPPRVLVGWQRRIAALFGQDLR
jgi:hypothetical protein